MMPDRKLRSIKMINALVSVEFHKAFTRSSQRTKDASINQRVFPCLINLRILPVSPAVQLGRAPDNIAD